ncbi:MAG: tetratricopeptide repeat protein [Planctomycetota bacterium]
MYDRRANYSQKIYAVFFSRGRWYYRGPEHYYANNYRQAIKLWELVLSDYSESRFDSKSEILYLLGICYEHLRNYNRAMGYYTEFTEKERGSQTLC